MFFKLLKKCALFMIGGLMLAAIVAGGWWYWTHRVPQFDALILLAFEKAALVETYGQHVETETDVDDRHIRVVGDYLIDDAAKQYSARATTTLTLPDGTSHSFTLHTVTIGEDMFTKVQSHSAALNLTVPSSPEWKQFKASAIPAEYREIATPRPPLDNLTLFKRGMEFLTLLKERREETVDGENLARYTFTLSSQALTEQTGPISMIAERVGANGTVDVWVDEATAGIRRIFFSQTPYFSSTTITHLNSPPLIIVPLGAAN